MNEREQQLAFSLEIYNLISRFGNEFEMSYQSMVGCLEIEKARLTNQIINPELYDEQ